MTERVCKTCGFWSQWQPSTGDCLLHAYERRNAIINNSEANPARAADATPDDHACSKWAPLDEVRDYVNGGAEPPAWSLEAT